MPIMNKTGPIVIIEDDADDQMLLNEIFKKLNYPNPIIYFYDGEEALNYLNTTKDKPFLILSDINMPRLDGFGLRNKVQSNAALHLKCIPYLFLTTGSTPKIVIEAYSKSIQGFFVKPSNFDDLTLTIKKIIEYWQDCIAPDYDIDTTYEELKVEYKATL